MSPALDLARLRDMGPDAAAAHWRVRLDAHPDDQTALFDQWLAESEDHRNAWSRAVDAWRWVDDEVGDPALEALRASVVARSAPRRRPAWTRIAAGLIVAVGVAMGGLLAIRIVPSRPTAPAAVASAERFETPVGGQSTQVLKDGSRVTLDTDTVVEVALSSARRDVRLVRGRAYFEVAHDARRPFAVVAGDRVVTALGTRFDARIDPGRVRVVMVEGRISITGRDRAPVFLQGGQVFAAQAGKAGEISPADPDEALNWRRGVVQFHDVTLAEAASELNRYTRDRLVIDDDAVASLRISGAFRTGDTARFGRTVAEILPVRLVVRAPGVYELVRTQGPT